MEYLARIFLYIAIILGGLFFISIIKFYFYRRRQIDKIKVVEFIIDSDKTSSTYNIHKSIFSNKKVKYVNELLKELESENLVKKVNMGISNGENGIWEYIK